MIPIDFHVAQIDYWRSDYRVGDTIRLRGGAMFTIESQGELDELNKRIAMWKYDQDEKSGGMYAATPSAEPLSPAQFRREPDLVRAELVDALRDYAQIFHAKARMESTRAENIELIALRVEQGGSAEGPDTTVSQEWERAYRLLEMRFEETRMRVNRLLLEHGNN
jgi:hypothetical protein